MKNKIDTIIFLFLILIAPNGFTQTWDEITGLIPSDLMPGGSNRFANAVSISGNYAIAASRDGNIIDPGAVYVYELDVDGVWNEVDKLTAADGEAADRFGNSISIDEDYIIVGAPNDSDDGVSSGSAYVYERNIDGDWIEVQKLTASDAGGSHFFGRSVSVYGDYAIIGVPGKNVSGINSGAAYLFERDPDGVWLEIQQLEALDGNAGDGFGGSISITENYVIIGARGNDDDGSNSGSAYIFEQDDDGVWLEVQKLTASDAIADEKFGNSVDIDNGRAIIGVQDDEAAEPYTGAAYVFERDVDGIWEEVEKLVASDPEGGKGFGWSVAIENDYVVVGSPQIIISEPTAGSAYVFQREEDGSWPEVQKITGSEWSEDVFADLFAFSVAISENHIIAGAPGTPFENEFFAYIFQGCVNMLVDVSSEEVCQGDEVILDATSLLDADITWSGGVVDEDSFIPPLGTTIYVATGSVEDCELQVEISVLETPIVEIIAGDTELCEGEEITLTASGAFTYEWEDEIVDGEAFEPPVGETTYTVIGTGDNGCESSVTIEILVHTLPEVIANADNVMVCEGDEIVLTGSGATEYSWNLGVTDGISLEPSVGETIYTVTGTDDNDCVSIDSILITVFENPDVEFIDLEDDLLCLDNGLITLIGTPVDGAFSGPGVAGAEFDPNVAGEGTHNLFYSFIDENGCSGIDSVEVNVVDCLGLKKLESNSFGIYPNPFSDYAIIEFNQHLSKDHQIVVYDILGHKVWQKMGVTGNQIKLTKTELATGVYYLSLMENGRILQTSKLIVE